MVPAVASARADTGRRLAQSTPRVLVVEDDYMIAWALTADLKEFGFAVVGPARNLADAAAMAATSALNCALIDIALNGESALPIAQILADRHIPFVFMTGAIESPEGRFQEVPTLLKPFTAENLRCVLQRLLQ